MSWSKRLFLMASKRNTKQKYSSLYEVCIDSTKKKLCHVDNTTYLAICKHNMTYQMQTIVRLILYTTNHYATAKRTIMSHDGSEVTSYKIPTIPLVGYVNRSTCVAWEIHAGDCRCEDSKRIKRFASRNYSKFKARNDNHGRCNQVKSKDVCEKTRVHSYACTANSYWQLVQHVSETIL